jgi:hypothetical protein
MASTMALRLVLVLMAVLGLKVGARWLFGPVEPELLTGLVIADLFVLFSAPSWVAMIGGNRATGPLRTFVTVPLVYIGLIAMNVGLQIPGVFASTPDVIEAMTRIFTHALPRAMLGGLAGALGLWLVATTVAFVFTGFKLRYVPTETDRKRADAFVASHYKVRLGRPPMTVAEARPEKVVSAKRALSAAAAAAAGLAAVSGDAASKSAA